MTGLGELRPQLHMQVLATELSACCCPRLLMSPQKASVVAFGVPMYTCCRQHQVDLVQEHFGLDYKEVVPTECLMYGNYFVPGAEPKVSTMTCLSPGT